MASSPIIFSRDTTLFAGNVDQKLTCPICTSILPFQRTQAVTSPCGHTFCLPCITESLRRNQICPLDRHPLKKSQLVPLPLLVSDILRELVAKCDHHAEGCIWQGSWEFLHDHIQKSCPFEPRDCKWAGEGCKSRDVLSKLTEHEKDCKFQHMQLARELMAPKMAELNAEISGLKARADSLTSRIFDLESANARLSAQTIEQKDKISSFKAEKSESKTDEKEEMEREPPKRPQTAFFLFMKEKRPQLELEGLRGIEAARKGGELWSQLSANAKQPYEESAAKLKEQYNRELAEYNAYKKRKEEQQPESSQAPRAKKRAVLQSVVPS